MTNSDDMPDKDALYGRYQDNADERAKMDLQNRKWQSQLHKQASYKALDEPMMDDEMGDIYAPKTITNTGLSGKALLALAAVVLPMVGLSGAAATLLISQWMNQPQKPAVQPPPATEQRDGEIVVPQLRFGPERDDNQEGR